MKKRYRVMVEEKYSKWVDVVAENQYELEDEVALMQESGEIEWDRGADFDEWNIVAYEEDEFTESELKYAKKWCEDMVTVAALMDSEWVLEGMSRDDCCDWLEQMRDNGVNIPKEITSEDLWDAVEKRRKEKK